ncbi:MAG: hypothetical protein K6F26_08745 [Lachnospiraceae bacterium]|nr:hypothetical protein [Lachnospiraceae bacterium]
MIDAILLTIVMALTLTAGAERKRLRRDVGGRKAPHKQYRSGGATAPAANATPTGATPEPRSFVSVKTTRLNI